MVRCCDLCQFETIVQTESEFSDEFEADSAEKSGASSESQSQINDNKFDSSSSATSAEKEILKIIFSCLSPSNSPTVDWTKNHGFPFLKLCSTCKLLLNFWWKTEKSICELQLKSRRLKSSLISRILQGMPNPESEFDCSDCGKRYKWYATLHEHRRRCCHSTNNEKSHKKAR